MVWNKNLSSLFTLLSSSHWPLNMKPTLLPAMFASVNYGVPCRIATPGPYRFSAGQTFHTGAETGETFVAGGRVGQVFLTGTVAGAVR